MIYSWQNVFQLMKDTQIQYDLVIRSRYDLGIGYPLNLDLIDGNFLHHAGNENFLDDNLCITNQKNAETLYYEVFYKLIKQSRKKRILNTAEESWTKIVEEAGLLSNVIKNPDLKFTLLRDNWLWWGDPQGNIISEKVLS
jgi:hypothetical protein